MFAGEALEFCFFDTQDAPQANVSASSLPSSTHWRIYRPWTLRAPQTSNLLRSRVGEAGSGAAVLDKIAMCGQIAVAGGQT
jgi:hypothetical protein